MIKLTWFVFINLINKKGWRASEIAADARHLADTFARCGRRRSCSGKRPICAGTLAWPATTQTRPSQWTLIIAASSNHYYSFSITSTYYILQNNRQLINNRPAIFAQTEHWTVDHGTKEMPLFSDLQTAKWPSQHCRHQMVRFAKILAKYWPNIGSRLVCLAPVKG